MRHLARDYPIAIVSGSAREDIARNIAMLGITEQVRFFISYEDCSPGKPHPGGYLLAAARLGVPPAACVVFEDSTAGVAAARAAGMHCVALRHRDRPPQELSGRPVVDDLRECPSAYG